MQTLSPLDAWFLHIEDAVTHMHIGSVGIFEGPPPSAEKLCGAIGARLPLVPRYRQKVRFVPLGLGRPVWVEDPAFDIDYHVRRTALASPGSERELRKLMGRVMSQQLDRNKPLWEIWVVEGLDKGRWAFISKSHHAMVDGVAATDLLSVLLDSQREPEPAPADGWNPPSEPASTALVTHAVAERALSPREGVRTVLAAVRGPSRVAREALSVGRGLMNLGRIAAPGSASSLNGPVGPHRRWNWARGRLADVKRIREAYGGTVNDVVLSVIAGGFRTLLLAHDEPVEDRVVRTLVPVSVRAEEERGTFNNKVSAMFAELPVGIDDPVARLEAIHEQMQELKQSGQAVAAERLTALGGFAPAMLLALAARVGSRLPQSSVNTVTTNVPGPQRSLYLGGRRMLEAFPFVPVGGSVRIGIAIFSYDGNINFGVTGDAAVEQDIAILCEAIEQSIAELLPRKSARPAARRQNSTRPRSKAAG